MSLSHLESIAASLLITLIFRTLSLTFPGAWAVEPDFLSLSDSTAPSPQWHFGHTGASPSCLPGLVLWAAGSLALLSLAGFLLQHF